MMQNSEPQVGVVLGGEPTQKSKIHQGEYADRDNNDITNTNDLPHAWLCLSILARRMPRMTQNSKPQVCVNLGGKPAKNDAKLRSSSLC